MLGQIICRFKCFRIVRTAANVNLIPPLYMLKSSLGTNNTQSAYNKVNMSLYSKRFPLLRIGGKFNAISLRLLSASKKLYKQSNCETDSIAHTSQAVGWWLVGCAVLVAGAVIIGGVTRLTESGLSMVNWHLIKGMKPPASEQEWEAEFENYKKFPEYEHVHKSFTVEDFKNIFYLEYAHRMWGRLIGVAYILPFTYFACKGQISKTLRPRLVAFGALLIAQGIYGWYMVKSGLEVREDSHSIPTVSQYRLAGHLGMAFLLYSGLLWTSLNILLPNTTFESSQAALKTFKRLAYTSKGMIFITALSGAFVAGLDAGLVYNSFPKMADRWFPSDGLAMSPLWKNLFENHSTVQFDHRVLATLTLLSVASTWLVSRRLVLPPRARTAVNGLAATVCLQYTLGIVTLLTYVPVSTASAHQTTSLLLLSYAIWLASELSRIPKI